MLILGLVDVPMWLILIPAIAVLLYLYGTRNFGAFKGTGIAGPKPSPFFGNTVQAIKEGFMTYDRKLKDKYGKVVGLFSGSQPAIMMFDYEMISQVTVKQFNKFTNRTSRQTEDKVMKYMLIRQADDEWKHTRSAMSPTFTTGKLRMMAGEINRCAAEFVKQITSRELPFEAREYAGNYTLDVIASTAFGLRVNSQADKDNAFVTAAKKITSIGFKSPILLLTILAPSLAYHLSKFGLTFFDKQATDFFMQVVSQTLDARKKGDQSRNDFIQLMTNAQQGGKNYEKEDEKEVEQHSTNISKTGLTKDEILSNAMLFFVAGHDTTSLGLTQLLYCLACNQDCQQKVLKEMDRVMGDKVEVDHDSVTQLNYLDQCFQESLRLYPPAHRLERKCKEDTVVEGYKFRKGMSAVIPVYALHYDPETWPNPEKFDPDRWGTHNHSLFKDLGIPGPKPLPFIGNMYETFKMGFMNIDTEMKKQYGKFSACDVTAWIGELKQWTSPSESLFSGSTPEIVIFDYEMISQVTVKQFNKFTNRRVFTPDDPALAQMLTVINDDQWKHARSTISPTFTTGKLRKMASEINRCAKELVTQITTGSQPFEARDYVGNYTLDVIASTGFGLRVSSQVEQDNAFVKNGKKILEAFGFKKPVFLINILSPTLGKIIGKLGFPLLDVEAADFFVKVIEQTLDARKEGNENRSDFIQLMTEAQQGKEIYDKKDEKEVETLSTNTSVVGLTKAEIVSNAILFFLAGFDTTATGLTQLLYSLACNPDCQEKVFEEIERVLGDKEEVGYDSVTKMTYLEQCLQETLRLYPPVPRIDRVAKEEAVVEGITVPKGAIVVVPVYALHHDPETWPDPEKFDPDRFSPEEKAKRNPIKWLPFGYGPRNCIGMRLAIYEIKVAVVYLLRKHKLVTCDRTEQPLTFSNNKWLAAEKGVWLSIEERK